MSRRFKSRKVDIVTYVHNRDFSTETAKWTFPQEQREEFAVSLEQAFDAVLEAAIERMPLKFGGIYDITVKERT